MTPRPRGEAKIKVTFYLLKRQKEALDALCAETRIVMSEHIREAIDLLLTQYHQPTPLKKKAKGRPL